MLIQLTELQGLPVASLNDEAKVASILDAVLHPDTGELVGFWVQPQGLFAKRKALSSRDILGYDPQAIVVQETDVLVDASEIQPFQSITKDHPTWIGKRVETAEGHALGTVSDVIINVDLEILTKLEVSSLFAPQRMIAREAILQVTAKAIVVDTEFEASPVQPVTARAATS